MVTKMNPQISMDEKLVNDQELEAMLEKRQELKELASQYRTADKEAKERISAIATPMPFRVGRFIISAKTSAGREVQFEIRESTRIIIHALGE